jgi:acetoin utilization protein AcuB
MLVADVMRTDVVTIRPDAAVQEAIELARTRGIRHLPVLQDGALVGIVSDRDLKRALVPEAAVRRLPGVRDLPARLTVADIMSRPVVTIGVTFAVEDAARVMVVERISALPVTDGARLVGIVTETDLLALLVRALGAVEPSSRLEVVLGDRPRALGEVIAAVEGAGATVSSVMTLRAPGGTREAVVRIATIDARPAVVAVESRGYAVRGPRRPT